MQENRWTFTSQGNPKGDEVIWLRDPLHSFDRSFSPVLPGEYYLTVVSGPEQFSEFSGSELLPFLKNRKKKPVLIAEGFSVRNIWPLLEKYPNLVQSVFLIFPQPLPISGFSVSFFDKADWFLRNMIQIPKLFLNPFGLEKVWTGLDNEGVYTGKLSIPLGLLLPRTVGPISSQAEALQNLSDRLTVFRWETQNPRFLEPDDQKMSKILESFLKSGGQKLEKVRSRARF